MPLVVVMDYHGCKELRLRWRHDRKPNNRTPIKAEVATDLEVVDSKSDGDIEAVLARLEKKPPDALVIEHQFLTHRNAIQIGGFLLKNRIPAISSHKHYVRLGGLVSYGVNRPANWRRAAVFVDKILKGAVPGNLLVEPAQLELVINLKTAGRTGVSMPLEILLEANEVIK